MMEGRILPLGMKVGIMMRELFRVLNKRIGEQLDIKLTFEQLGLLFAISSKEEEVIQKDLASMMGKDKSSILRLIDSLEKKKLVRRVVDTNDRRKNCLMITKKGERILAHNMEIVYDFMAEVEQGLTESEMDTFYKVVNHIKCKSEKL